MTSTDGDRWFGDLSGSQSPSPVVSVDFGYSSGVRVYRQSVETFLSNSPRPLRGRESTFIVDPPRTGMTRDALAGIIAHRPPLIVYVSCDVATLARDARMLVDAGWDRSAVRPVTRRTRTAALRQERQPCRW